MTDRSLAPRRPPFVAGLLVALVALRVGMAQTPCVGPATPPGITPMHSASLTASDDAAPESVPPPAATPIQAKRFAIAVRLASDSPEASDVTLWYTRDRGQTWHRGPKAIGGQEGIAFEAKGEGLYGFFVSARAASGASTPEPQPGTPPQRWAFVDYTPPLVQWKNIDVVADRSGQRRLIFDWVAHDANLDGRPIALSYQPAGHMTWQPIDSVLPNTGRMDWSPPDALTGRVTFKLKVRDLGGHTIERLFGPISLDSPRIVGAPASQPTTRAAVQASPTASAPGDVEPMPTVGAADRVRAQQLYERGTWHRERGQLPDAALRYREALDLDSTLLAVRTDLAGVYYAQGRYGDAIAEYRRVLQSDADRVTALRGLALAHVAVREYAPAMEALERVVQREPDHAQAWLELGDVLYQMGDRLGAREHWTKAAALDHKATDVSVKAQNRLSLFPAGVGK